MRLHLLPGAPRHHCSSLEAHTSSCYDRAPDGRRAEAGARLSSSGGAAKVERDRGTRRGGAPLASGGAGHEHWSRGVLTAVGAAHSAAHLALTRLALVPLAGSCRLIAPRVGLGREICLEIAHLLLQLPVLSPQLLELRHRRAFLLLRRPALRRLELHSRQGPQPLLPAATLHAQLLDPLPQLGELG